MVPLVPVGRIPRLRIPLRSAGLLFLALSTGCGGRDPDLPRPRPLIIHSGARLTPEADRMEEIDDWVRAEMQNIQEDPGFWVITHTVPEEAYPWETLETEGDTARIGLETGAVDATGPYMIYAHLHLMHELGRLGEFVPDAADETGYDLERAIVGRVADGWLLGRSVYDFTPYRPLDEIIYAREEGFLDPYLLTARAEAFPEAREEWMEENPGRQEEFEDWFRATFGMEPPGLREEDPAEEDPAEEDPAPVGGSPHGR